jgi:hypothetical protein
VRARLFCARPRAFRGALFAGLFSRDPFEKGSLGEYACAPFEKGAPLFRGTLLKKGRRTPLKLLGMGKRNFFKPLQQLFPNFVSYGESTAVAAFSSSLVVTKAPL